jgi:hypothetical protein
MLIYVLWWWPSWISDWQKKQKVGKGHSNTLDPMGKCSNAFFSETTNMIKAKLYMNVHWMVLYKLYVFCSDMKFKMAATAGRPSWISDWQKKQKVGKGHSNDHSFTVWVQSVHYL